MILIFFPIQGGWLVAQEVMVGWRKQTQFSDEFSGGRLQAIFSSRLMESGVPKTKNLWPPFLQRFRGGQQ